MAVNKVAYGSNVLIDLSADTLSSAAQIAEGIIGHLRDGTKVTGTMTSGGGLPSAVKAFDAGDITISTDFTTTRQTFRHSLGVTPDFVMVFASGNVAQTYSMLFAIRSTLMGYRSSAYNLFMGYHGNNSTTTVSMTNSNSTTYGVSNMTASNFQLASASSSYYWRKGTYKYIAIKFA